MSDENQNVGDLSADETAYFESGGETALPPEPEQPAETKPEEQQPDPQPRDEKGKFVPHQVFHAEREEHKRTKAEVQELREFRAKVEERLKWTDALLQPHQQPKDEDPEPDPNQDIFAHNAWLKRQVSKVTQERAQERQQIEQARQAEQQEAALWQSWHDDAADFKNTVPDFGDAAQFLAEARDKQLQALAVVEPQFRTKEGRDRQMNAELAQIIQQARSTGVRSTQAIYDIAKSWGFTGAGPAAQGQPPALSEKLAGIAKAQEASRSVGQTSGRAGDDPLSAEAILNMPEKEFMEWVKVPANEKRFRQLTEG